jgi:hypothetical protein
LVKYKYKRLVSKAVNFFFLVEGQDSKLPHLLLLLPRRRRTQTVNIIGFQMKERRSREDLAWVKLGCKIRPSPS